MKTPAPLTVLYDGACPFCTGSARAIRRVFGTRRVTLSDFQQPGALDPYPALRHDVLMQKMHVVMPDGRVFAGAEAFARIVASVPVIGWIGWLYYVPGARQVADGVYALVARYRYDAFGRRGECDGESCKAHDAYRDRL